MFASRLQILDRAKTWAFPPDCLRCGDRVEIPYGLCGPCWAEAKFIGKSCCHACGDELIGEEAAPSDLCDACLMRPPPWDAGPLFPKPRKAGFLLFAHRSFFPKP